MKKKKQHLSFTNNQVVLLCVIIAIVSFASGIFMETTFGPSRATDAPIENQYEKEEKPNTNINQDTSTSTDSSNKASTDTSNDITTPSVEPLTPDSLDNTSASVNTTEPPVETEEEIWKNPKSKKRSDSIADPQAFHETIKNLYLTGEWNGEPMVFDGHYITLSSDGYICADMYILDSHENLDIPQNFDDKHPMDSCNFWYISGKGTYIVDDETYFKCYKGKVTTLGKIDDWKEGTGVDIDYHHPIIYYDEVNDKLFLWSPMIYTYKEVYDYTYLYFFPDYDVAKIKFIAQVKDIDFDEKGIKFMDMDGAVWRYSNNDGKDSFVNSLD